MLRSIVRPTSVFLVVLALAVLLGIQHGLAQGSSLPDTLIMLRHCPPTPTSRWSNPSVRVESITLCSPRFPFAGATDSSILDAAPRPVDGMKSLGALAEYPDLAVRAGIDGAIQVQVVLDEEGIPRDMRILRSDGEIFAEPSIQAVRKTSFAPAVFRGKRVPAAVAITFRYSLLEEPRVDVNISELEFHELSGMIGPRYHLTFRKNGTAEYDGSGFMDMTGLHVGTIRGDDFYRLSLVLGWFCFLDTSSRTSFLGISDGWEEHVRVLCDGHWVERRFDGGDERVWGMARLMEACARTITWSKMEKGK